MKPKIRVLIVDDSAFARFAIARHLREEPGMEVIDFARDGAEALEKIPALNPDVVTLDVEMPRMDGLKALESIMTTCPVPVVMLSTLTGSDTAATIRALELGAADFFPKTSITNPTGRGKLAGELIGKLRIAAGIKAAHLKKAACGPPLRPKLNTPEPGIIRRAKEVVVIGSSTGGPRALYQVIPALPQDIPAAVLIVQHMPPGFTRSLSERLDQLSAIRVKEAETGNVLRQGEALVAPGGYHMALEPDATINLNQAPAVCGVRPSVDVTMKSAAGVFGAAASGVVLTGMGADGTAGTAAIKAAGGRVIAEDESTCTVYGMPRSVAEAGNADRIVPLHKVAAEIVRLLKNKEQKART